ncbi:MAG: class I SAM-dependent methyltransferase [Deltaproteobacteria bacterium]|nr:class I SAM-dependent methyltransferase [Deltaproteobacteria bacterium]
MKVPFWCICQIDSSLTFSQEELLAKKMGIPPWKTGKVDASIPAAAWAAEIGSAHLGLIFDQEFWYGPELWAQWLHALEREGTGGIINAPVGNQDPSWRKFLKPQPYLTLNGLEKASNKKGRERWFIRPCIKPEGFMVVVVPLSSLTSLPSSLRLGELPEYWAGRGEKVRIFCEGWLHAFNDVREAGSRKDLLAMCKWEGKVLELGCGRGLMAKLCKKTFPKVMWFGVDFHLPILNQARMWMDAAVQADVQRGLPFTESVRFDRIVCADLLEHLPYPWETLGLLRSKIKPDGLLVASVPNIGHWSVVEDLLMGRFDETPAGIMCVTHLRFGTRKSWQRWLQDNGWHTYTWEEEKLSVPSGWIVPSHTLQERCDMESLETIRYRVIARPV